VVKFTRNSGIHVETSSSSRWTVPCSAVSKPTFCSSSVTNLWMAVDATAGPTDGSGGSDWTGSAGLAGWNGGKYDRGVGGGIAEPGAGYWFG